MIIIITERILENQVMNLKALQKLMDFPVMPLQWEDTLSINLVDLMMKRHQEQQISDNQKLDT